MSRLAWTFALCGVLSAACAATQTGATEASLAQARGQIESLHLSMGQISFHPDPKSLPQTVLSQTPEPGAALKGEPVDLVVSQ